MFQKSDRFAVLGIGTFKNKRTVVKEAHLSSCGKEIMILQKF